MTGQAGPALGGRAEGLPGVRCLQRDSPAQETSRGGTRAAGECCGVPSLTGAALPPCQPTSAIHRLALLLSCHVQQTSLACCWFDTEFHVVLNVATGENCRLNTFLGTDPSGKMSDSTGGHGDAARAARGRVGLRGATSEARRRPLRRGGTSKAGLATRHKRKVRQGTIRIQQLVTIPGDLRGGGRWLKVVFCIN